MAALAFQVVATIAGIAKGVHAAISYLTSDLSKIEIALTKKSGGKTTYTVAFDESKLELNGDSFDIKVSESGTKVTAEKAKAYLEDILNAELKSQFGSSASIKLVVTKVLNTHQYGNGKAKGLKDGTSYTLHVKNDQKSPAFPTLYCDGVVVQASEPYLNTWLVSEHSIAGGNYQDLTWELNYIIGMYLNDVQDGVQIGEAQGITDTLPLGSIVNYTMDASDTWVANITQGGEASKIQVVIETGHGKVTEQWAVGFNIGGNAVLQVTAEAGKTFNFTPHPTYKLALTDTNNSNHLVTEDSVTDYEVIIFGQTELWAEYSVDGSWKVTPKAWPGFKPLAFGAITSAIVPPRLLKKTVTHTVVEEYGY